MPTVKERIKSFVIANDRPFYYKKNLATIFQTNERVVRDALSELREEGIHYYFGVGKGLYRKLTEKDSDIAERYMFKIVKSLSTIYFRTLIPLKRFIKNEKLKQQMEQLSLIFDEPGEQK